MKKQEKGTRQGISPKVVRRYRYESRWYALFHAPFLSFLYLYARFSVTLQSVTAKRATLLLHRYTIRALNSEEGELSSERRGPEHGRPRQIINRDAETTSSPFRAKTKGYGERAKQTVNGKFSSYRWPSQCG